MSVSFSPKRYGNIDIKVLLNDIMILARAKNTEPSKAGRRRPIEYLSRQYNIDYYKASKLYKEVKMHITVISELIGYKNKIDKKIQKDRDEDYEFERKQIRNRKHRERMKKFNHFGYDNINNLKNNNINHINRLKNNSINNFNHFKNDNISSHNKRKKKLNISDDDEEDKDSPSLLDHETNIYNLLDDFDINDILLFQNSDDEDDSLNYETELNDFTDQI